MAGPDPLSFETLSLHAGQHPDPATPGALGARATPIDRTTSFVFDDANHAAALFNLERAGHIHSRISNPTIAMLEERMAHTLPRFGLATTFVNPRDLDGLLSPRRGVPRGRLEGRGERRRCG